MVTASSFARQIKTLINTSGNWTETTPAFADVKFPYKVSRNFEYHAARKGPWKNMIWALQDRKTPRELAGSGPYQTFGIDVNVYCYSRATSELEADVDAAEVRSENMRVQVEAIIAANPTGLTGAVQMRKNGGFQMNDPNANPAVFMEIVKVLVIL